MHKLLNKIRQYKNWQELKSELMDISDNTKVKGDIFELVTKYYLLTEPIYQTQIKNVWIHNEVPEDIREYINLPKNDEGIDLIAQTKDNKYWAIQCKYLSDDNASINEKYITTFLNLAGNVCKNISVKLTTTTANKKSYKFEEKYDDSVTFLLGDIWSNLNESFFNNLNSYLDNKQVVFKPFEPKIHQSRAIDNAYNHFIEESNDRGKLIMACGSGKSLTAYWIVNKLHYKKILIAVPSLALVKQTLEVWARESLANNIDINWIAVCSDESIKKVNDSFTTSTKDLGIEVSTNIKNITNWLKNTNQNTTIVFTTYHSGKVIAEASKNANFVFDIGIMDEAHKTVGNKNNLFCHLLFDENIDIKKRLFMTATERMYKGDIDKDQIVSMDDIDLYGEDFEVLTFREAIEMNPPILCDYKVISIIVTKKEIKEIIDKNKYINIDEDSITEQETSNIIASSIVLQKAIKKYDIKHTVSFHATVKKSKYFKEKEKHFNAGIDNSVELKTYHVSGKTPTNERNLTINDFSNSKNGLITNARCLTEGIDVPNIDCVMFSDPRQSTVDIVQAVGRAIRLSDNKKFGYVLVPIIIDEDEDLENIKQSSYQAIINILRSLSSNDDRIFDYLQTTDSGQISNGSGFINIDVPVGLNIDINDFTESIRIKILEKTKKLKYRSFQEARDFARGLKINNTTEWKLYCRNKLAKYDKKPFDIPTSPSKIYASIGWKNIKDWLGTRSDIKYLPFEEAREYVRSLGLKTSSEWQKYCVGKIKNQELKPDNIPRNPSAVYKKEFRNYKDWLNEGLMSFEKAREFVISLNIDISGKTSVELDKIWRNYCNGEIKHLPKKPDSIPRNVTLRYRRNWINWEDWFTGTTKKLHGEWREFKKAREFVRNLGLSGQIEWREYCKGNLEGYNPKPVDIPTSPSDRYTKEDGWINTADWLGTKRIRRKKDEDVWLPYEKAREFVHKLNLKSMLEWTQYINGELTHLKIKPNNIPNSPLFVYKNNGWISLSDWIGHGNIPKTKVQNALSFKDARLFVRKLGLKNTYEWEDYKKRKLTHLEPIPDNIPKTPRNTYKNDGWIGMHDWLGIK